MLIDQVFPQVIAETSTLLERLVAEAAAGGISQVDTAALIAVVPTELLNSGAFLDRLTNLWRYEFGVPFQIGGSYYWGTHMWPPVAQLFTALVQARKRLSDVQFPDYVARLSNPEKHQAILVEMIPAAKVDSAVQMEFEVAGLGAGNRTVDWVVHPHDGSLVLLDVKNRTTDFIQQAEQMVNDSSAQRPLHDPTLLFRSVEQKFLPANPDAQLQGVWICTHIQQHEPLLNTVFLSFCADSIHFAILGDWKPDAYVLARRPQDRQRLLELFNLQPSTRFTFTDSKRRMG